MERTLHILGGGPAGLGAGYFARKNGLKLVLHEANSQVGGNCRTIKLDQFLFDTGAHRFHDKDDLITNEIKRLLGDDLTLVSAPSTIYSDGLHIDFPLHSGDLLRKLPKSEIVAITWEVLKGLSGKSNPSNFQELALSRFGPTLANRFLLNYSTKLWGEDPENLSTTVSGKRLQGLHLKALIQHLLSKKESSREHLDGTFYYPKYGIGMIPNALAEAIGSHNIKVNSRITSLRHNGREITSLLINGKELQEIRPTDSIICTLPIHVILQQLEPRPPLEILETAKKLRYRNLILGVFGLQRERLTENASIYFPDASIPFTRLYESKNRSAHMAPPGMTSIAIELPCNADDRFWKMNKDSLRGELYDILSKLFSIREEEIIAFEKYSVPYAYPVLRTGVKELVEKLRLYLSQFQNLWLAGRNAQFQYVHVHDLLRAGMETVEQIQFGDQSNARHIYHDAIER